MKDTERSRILRWESGAMPEEVSDDLAGEEPLEIRVGGKPVSVTMRTPGHDPELAAGFLFTEGIIQSAMDLRSARPVMRKQSCNVINAALAPGLHFDLVSLTRHVFASSSCGICGKASIESIHRQFPPVESELRIRAEVLLQLPAQLQRAQPAFERTGGLHAAGVFDLEGNLIVSREDVGRHNAVDKAVGYCLLKRLLPLERHVMLVSGRASFEIMQKALAARVPFVAAVSAPSSLAAEFARTSGQTLIGFLRDGRMNIYSSERRILFNSR
ncbi:MAG: formate dehydrogenase accessory sulfurtransferase FdhD [Bryobacteraceae bacterium]